MPTKMKNKKPGSELRDKVADLLRLSHSTVGVEVPLQCTTADILFVDERNKNFPIKIAVECKDWSNPIVSTNIAEIDNLYRPSLSSGEIDYLWIIANFELGQSPSQNLLKLKKVKYSSFDTFQKEMMNFSNLLSDNIARFKVHDSHSNFIQSNLKNSVKSLSHRTTEFLDDATTNALIVFGGYGIGKTSFSLFLASRLSEEYNRGQFNRIPIRIQLGGLHTKQDLKALICSTLTGSEDGPSVGNFSYYLFLRMVALGHFVLILDGFDEMRHTW